MLELIRLDSLGPHTDAYRETREHFWIYRLRTLQAMGLNANEKKYKWKRGNLVGTATTSNQSGTARGHESVIKFQIMSVTSPTPPAGIPPVPPVTIHTHIVTWMSTPWTHL